MRNQGILTDCSVRDSVYDCASKDKVTACSLIHCSSLLSSPPLVSYLSFVPL